MKAPGFWFTHRDRPGFLPRMLHPLSILWRVLSDERQRRGKHKRVDVPVICVGNINVGGSGKTPTVIALLALLNELGHQAHVISKGYGGSLDGPLRIDEAIHTASEVGDEPLLIAAFGTCWVARDRLAGAQAAIKAGAEVILLDDGMQYPDLFRDFTLLVVDLGVGFGNGRLLPAGPLRQSVSDGALTSDMILGIGTGARLHDLARQWPALHSVPNICGTLEPLDTGMLWGELRAFAFAGIGRPEKFFETLRSTGATVVGTRSFGDHETLSSALLRRLEFEADQLGAQMVTTEKDAVRLPRSFRHKVITLPVRLQLDEREVLLQALNQIMMPNP